jgi:hypothetical protein
MTRSNPNGWIQTVSGKKFFPMEPHADDLDIRDIAHALSNQCRWGGHCLRFYSVAEHSFRVLRCLQYLGYTGRDILLWGLLHDAAEAYLCDLPRPVKEVFPAYREAEDKILKVVANKYNLPWPMPREVHVADDTLLVTERRDLTAMGDALVRSVDGPEIVPLNERIPTAVRSPAQAAWIFLQAFNDLEKTGD